MQIVRLTKPANIAGIDYPAGRRIDNFAHASTVESLLRVGLAVYAAAKSAAADPKPKPEGDDEPEPAPQPGTPVTTAEGEQGEVADVDAEPIDDEPIDDEPAADPEPDDDDDDDGRGVAMDAEPDDDEPADAIESEELEPEPIDDDEPADDRPIAEAGLAEGWTEKLTAAGLDTIGKAKAKAAQPGYLFESIKGIGGKAETKIRETLAAL